MAARVFVEKDGDTYNLPIPYPGNWVLLHPDGRSYTRFKPDGKELVVVAEGRVRGFKEGGE